MSADLKGLRTLITDTLAFDVDRHLIAYGESVRQGVLLQHGPKFVALVKVSTHVDNMLMTDTEFRQFVRDTLKEVR